MAAAAPKSLRHAGIELVEEACQHNRPLTALVISMLVALIIFAIGWVVDPRIITGAPVWLKPAKFAVSIAIYGATLLWLLTYVTDRPRLVAVISWLVALGVGIELILVAMQAFRGTTSH